MSERKLKRLEWMRNVLKTYGGECKEGRNLMVGFREMGL